jgi:ribosomal protein L40E
MEIAVLVIVAAASAVAVLQPVFQPPPATAVDFDGAPATPEARESAMADLEPELARYRAALLAGTLCMRCGQANPGDSRFCYECGRPLRAKEQPAEAP